MTLKSIFLPLLFLTAYTAAASDSTLLSGLWKSAPKGDVYCFSFGKDSSMRIIHGTDTTKAYYSIDTAHAPMHINMHVCDRVYGEILYTQKGIFERMGKDKIRLRFSQEMKERPGNFLPKGNPDVFVLVRQED